MAKSMWTPYAYSLFKVLSIKVLYKKKEEEEPQNHLN